MGAERRILLIKFILKTTQQVPKIIPPEVFTQVPMGIHGEARSWVNISSSRDAKAVPPMFT